MLIRRDYFERTGVKYGSTFCNMVQYYAMIVSAATAKRKIDGKKRKNACAHAIDHSQKVQICTHRLRGIETQTQSYTVLVVCEL